MDRPAIRTPDETHLKVQRREDDFPGDGALPVEGVGVLSVTDGTLSNFDSRTPLILTMRVGLVLTPRSFECPHGCFTAVLSLV